jgi:hypothetical protein
MAHTSDGTTLRLYVDGKLAGNTPAITSPDTSDPLEIGHNQVFDTYFEGEIDEVRVYDQALSEAQIQIDSATPVEAPPGSS